MKKYRGISLFVLLFLILGFAVFTFRSHSPTVSAQTENTWPMVAGNPERTSWTPEQVTGSLKVEAYRVIESYIPQNVQIIAANNLLYVATARGLLALYASDPDGTGSLRPLDVKWRFDTEVPLGNSPTVDTSTNIIYVPGYDRNLYALDALTGEKKWQYSEAKAGYSTNPVVADNKVMLGNRDGYFYAINKYVSATNPGGTLAWKYQTEGPINFSAAYKNNVVYFASMDNRAYALNTTGGSLIWKSNVMYGDGYSSYWPVIYTEPVSGQDYVVFADSVGYRTYISSQPGVGSLPTCSGSWMCDFPEWADEWRYNFSGTLANTVSRSDAWVQGKTVLDYVKLSQYFEDNPNNQNPDLVNGVDQKQYHKAYRRYYYIYNTSNGTEWSMDTDSDGFKEYVPSDPIYSNSGNVYPPIAIGNQTADKRLLYLGNHYDTTTTERIEGWRMGTNYMTVLPFMDNNGDEPVALSAGGNIIYRSIINSRAAEYVDSTSGGQHYTIYDYTNTLDSKAPGYDEMWYYQTDWSDYAGLYGYFSGIPGPNGRASTGSQNPNGVYGNHGDMNPLVPYKGKLYTHRANSIFIFGTGTSSGKITPYVPIVSVKQTLNTPSVDELKSRLETEIMKFDTNGDGVLDHLRPGYYNAGQQNDTYRELRDYFARPGDTLYALSLAYPYISNTTANNNLKDRLKTYLKSEFNNFTRINWTGAKREWAVLPPEVESDMANGAPVQASVDSYYNYALWKYVQNVAPEDKTSAIAKTTTSGSGMDDPYVTYRSNAGAIGLANLNGQTPSYNCPTFTKNSNFSNFGQRVLNIARNFMFIVPEVATKCLRNTTVTGALTEYEKIGPYWFVSRYAGSVGESTTQHLYDYPSLFAAKAFVQQLPREELTKWLDVPAFKVGDLFYIQNVVAAIEAPSSGPSPTAGPSPTITITPTAGPTATPTVVIGNGDANGDSSINIADILTVLQNYGKSLSTSIDQYGDRFINAFDFSVVLNKILATAPSITPTGTGPSLTPVPTTTSLLPAGNWTQTFADEFNGTTLDSSKWAKKYAYQTDQGDRSNNDEDEWYVDDAQTVSGGVLSLTANRGCLNSSRSEYYSPYNCTNFPYTSGMISSHNRFSQQYGYFEARIKIPSGAGLWPAFWLLPNPLTVPALPAEPTPWPDTNVLWPPEVDILENLGWQTNVIKMNNMYSTAYPTPGNSSNGFGAAYDLYDSTSTTTDYALDYHVYGLDWEPGLLVWYIDGVEKHRVTSYVPPANRPMYIIANLAVGGTTGGDASGTTFPKSLLIDYIRVFQKVTSTPTPTTISSGPTPTRTPTPTPVSGSQTIDFSTYSGTEAMSGEYPTGIINWGSGSWSYDSGTWGGCTRSVWFTNNGVTSNAFTFVSPHTLISLTACNGGSASSTITVSCSGNTTASTTVPAGSSQTLSTNWSSTCSSVTVTSSNGNDTNFDNIVYR